MASTTPPADLPRLAPRDAAASKRDFGRVVVAGGAAGMAGAPALAAMAALRSGAGLVELLVPDTVAPVSGGFDPCLMTHGLPAADGMFAPDAAAAVLGRMAAADAVAVGPGMGRSVAVRDLVLRIWREVAAPAVFDADALWALAAVPAGVLRDHAAPRVLTPHAGEMLRLLGRDPRGPEAGDRPFLEKAATETAAALDALIVLKGAGTFLTGCDRHAHNETGNPGMATAGTGDVLSGVVVALVAQGYDVFAAARLAVWVHGRAGDVAARDLGQTSMTARDLLDRLHVAFQELEGRAGEG
jgi:NAD(P)H-hydrate epimerase